MPKADLLAGSITYDLLSQDVKNRLGGRGGVVSGATFNLPTTDITLVAGGDINAQSLVGITTEGIATNNKDNCINNKFIGIAINYAADKSLCQIRIIGKIKLNDSYNAGVFAVMNGNITQEDYPTLSSGNIYQKIGYVDTSNNLTLDIQPPIIKI